MLRSLTDRGYSLSRSAKIAAVCAAIAAATLCANAEAPKGVSDFPIFPGAAFDEAGTRGKIAQYDPAGGAFDSASTPSRVLSRDIKIWTTTASPESAFDFYLSRFSAKAGGPDRTNLYSLKIGSVSAVRYERIAYDVVHNYPDQWNDDGARSCDNAWIRSRLATRKKTSAGEWIDSANFSWEYRDGENTLVEFTLYVWDRGFLNYFDSYRPKTEFELFVERKEILTEGNADAAVVAGIEGPPRDIALWLKANPPTQGRTGVLPYPKATFDLASSADMSGGDSVYYVLRSDDPPAKAAAFYERGAGKSAKPGPDEGCYTILIAGPSEDPDRAILVLPNEMYGGTGGSVIMIVVKGLRP